MPVHENEHARESLRRAPQHGAGDHLTGIDSQTRRVADSPDARTEQVEDLSFRLLVMSSEVETSLIISADV